MKTTDLAHHFWSSWVKPGQTLIDATCGNGQDTCFLAQLLQGKGSLIGYDLQKEAVERTQELLKTTLSEKEHSLITLHHLSHENFIEQEAHLIVYNLGYLPRGDKTLTTKTKTTLLSLQSAMHILLPGGHITLTCYPGHVEGEKEAEAIVHFTSSLPNSTWNVLHFKWINRVKAPFLVILEKAQKP